MRGYRRPNLIILISSVVAVLLLTIGFSAYSSNLIIKSKLRVDPIKDFKIVFSSDRDKLKTDDIKPTTTPIGLKASNAIINNSGIPTLSNLSVELTEPGDKVTYSLYVRNEGRTPAYLTGIEFNNVDGTSKYKVCESTLNSLPSISEDVCNRIKVTIKVGNEVVTGQKLEIQDHYLEARQSELVEITVEFVNNGMPLPEDDFRVRFGDITLNYASEDTYISTNESPSTGDNPGKQCVEWEEVAPESWYIMCDSFSDYETYISQGSDSYGCYYITYQYAEEMELGPNDSIYRAAKNKFCNGCANISVYTFDCTGSDAWEPMCKFRVTIDTGPIRECVRWE